MSTTIPSMQQLLAFLQKSSSYPHRPPTTKLIQTHASVVAIAPPYAYKFKKQLDFGFMDFRQPEVRRNNCLKELRLNRRLCPEIYLDVLPLYLQGDKLSFTPGGVIVDHALKMKQLPDGYFLDQLITEKQLTSKQLEPVLQRLKTFYQEQPADASIAAYGDIAHLKQQSSENFKSLGEMSPDLIAPATLRTIEQQTSNFYRQHAALLEQRLATGRIRDCHGDLHLNHIHLQGEKVCIYDCIEFSDRFRYMDIASDIAFLAMDLDFAGKPELSVFVATRMAALMEDPGMLLLMDFYKSYRACVRAKVEGIRALQPEISMAEKRAGHEKIKRYMQLALQYSLSGTASATRIKGGK